MKDITPNPFSQADATMADHHKTHTLAKVLGVFAILVLVVLLILIYQKRVSTVSKNELELLEQVSEPVRSTKEEQVTAMQELQTQQTSLSTQERQDMLNALQ